MKIVKILIEDAEEIGEVYYAEEIRCFVKAVEANGEYCKGCPGLENGDRCLLRGKCGFFNFIKVDKFE